MNELIEDRTSFKKDQEKFFMGYQSEPSSVNRLQIGAGFLTNVVTMTIKHQILHFKNRLDLLSQTSFCVN